MKEEIQNPEVKTQKAVTQSPNKRVKINVSFRYDEKRYEDKTFIPEANSVGSNNSPISRAPNNVTEEKKNDESLADVLADLEKHVGAQSKDSDSIFYGDILRTI